MKIKNLNPVVKITTSCPANCKCCVNRQNTIIKKNEENNIMGISEFKKICEIVRLMGGKYICLSGGEPSIVPQLGEYIKIANGHGLSSRINTNGWGITTSNLENWIANGLEQVVLSLYSLNSDTMKEVRGSDVLLNKTIKAAERLSRSRKYHNFTYIVQTLIICNNFREMPSLLKFAIKMKADYFWPTYLENAICLPEVRMTKMDIVEYKKVVVPEMINVISESEIDCNLMTIALETLQKHYYNEFDDYIYHDDDYICNWLGRHITFYPNGTVYPCPGHEYYSSKYEKKFDYMSCSLEDFASFLKSVKGKRIEFCKFCPQGEFGDIQLR